MHVTDDSCGEHFSIYLRDIHCLSNGIINLPLLLFRMTSAIGDIELVFGLPPLIEQEAKAR